MGITAREAKVEAWSGQTGLLESWNRRMGEKENAYLDSYVAIRILILSFFSP